MRRRIASTAGAAPTTGSRRRRLGVPVFLRRAGKALIGQGGQAAAAFLLTIVVSRAVDPSIRGAFVLLTLIPQIGAYFVTLGLPGAIMRSAAAEPEQRPAMLGVSAIAALAGGLVLTALTPPLMALAHADSPPILLVLAGSTSLTWLILAAWFSFGCERFLLAGALRTLPILGTALAILLLRANRQVGLVAMFAPWAGLHALVAATSALTLTRRYRIARPSRRQTEAWIGYGMRYSGIQILNLVTLRLDQLLLGWLGTTAAVGLYSIGVSLSEGLLLVTTVVGLIVFIDSAKGEASASFKRKLWMATGLSCLAAALLAVAVGPLVPALFGARYDPAVALTRILLLGTPGLVVMRLTTDRLAGLGAPGRASIYALVSLASTSALDVLLIPSHGATGAAWASTVGYSVGGAVALLSLRRVGVVAQPAPAPAAADPVTP